MSTNQNEPSMGPEFPPCDLGLYKTSQSLHDLCLYPSVGNLYRVLWSREIVMCVGCEFGEHVDVIVGGMKFGSAEVVWWVTRHGQVVGGLPIPAFMRLFGPASPADLECVEGMPT